MRSFLDYGIRAAPGSDYVRADRTDDGASIMRYANRQQRERLGRQPAHHGNGIHRRKHAKRLRFLRGESQGTLEPGMLADLVVLGRDPFTEDPST